MSVTRRIIENGTTGCISFTVTFVLLAGLSPQARAGFVGGGATGLTSPSNVITFNEVGPLTGQSVGNQFAAFGATFSGGFLWDTGNFGAAGSTGFSGADLTNIHPDSVTFNPGPFVISFTSPVTDAMFAIVDQSSSYQFNAFLGGTGGTLVDSGTAIIPYNPGAGFVGFNNELFDTIVFSDGGTAMAMDTLQFNAVPEPSSVVLGLVATVALSAMAIRNRRRAA